MIHSIKSAHCLVIDSNYVWLIDFYSSNSFFDEALCFSCWFFSNIVDAAVTALLSFHQTKVTLSFLSFTISHVPLDLFFTSLTDINGKFSIVVPLCQWLLYLWVLTIAKDGTCEEVVHNNMVTGFRYGREF